MTGIGIISGIILVGIVVYAIRTYRIQELLLRIGIYCVSAYFFWVVSLAFLDKTRLWLSWVLIIIATTLLIFIHKKKKSNGFDKVYILKNSILSAICFGMLPLTLYFSAFFVLNDDYVFERYFDNAEEIHYMLDNTDILENLASLNNYNFDSEYLRRFSRNVSENENVFLTFCYETEEIIFILETYQMTPSDLYDYFAARNDVYNKFDMNFSVFGIASGVLIFCFYHNYVNRNRKQVLKFGIFIVSVAFLSTFSDGAIIYLFFMLLNIIDFPNQTVTISAGDINTIQEILMGMSIIFGVFIAVDRAYPIGENKKI